MSIAKAAALLHQASRVVAFTGAGFSTASGIPDFRSADNGLWQQYDPMAVASLSVFRTHPDRFFAWIQPLARQILQAEPNPAHLALAEMEARGRLHTVITQNIDGLHQRAGSRHVIEVHGSLATMTCVECFRQYPSQAFVPHYLETGEMPRCGECRGILKPNAVLFEEQLPYAAWQAALDALANCDVLIVAGSSLEVMPVAGLPMRALEHGASLLLINHTHTYLDERATVRLDFDVAEALPLIVEACAQL